MNYPELLKAEIAAKYEPYIYTRYVKLEHPDSGYNILRDGVVINHRTCLDWAKQAVERLQQEEFIRKHWKTPNGT